MNRRTAQYTWAAKLVLAACFFAPMAPAMADEPEPAVPSSEFRGKVLGTDGQPAAGVEILTYHLATAELFITTTDGSSAFTLIALPYGYFDLAVRCSDGLYVADEVVNVSSSGDNVVEYRLQAFGKSNQADYRTFPGANEVAVGLVRVINQKKDGGSFWRSPKGISIASGGGALLLLTLGGGSSEEPPASPFTP